MSNKKKRKIFIVYILDITSSLNISGFLLLNMNERSLIQSILSVGCIVFDAVLNEGAFTSNGGVPVIPLASMLIAI